MTMAFLVSRAQVCFCLNSGAKHPLTPQCLFCFHSGYDPTSVHFQKAAEYFWNHYSKEEDSWRDQPLWCHTMEHFHIKPIILEKDLFRQHKERMGRGEHRYDASQDNDAAVAANASAASSSKLRV
jgi:hypothetical protein